MVVEYWPHVALKEERNLPFQTSTPTRDKIFRVSQVKAGKPAFFVYIFLYLSSENNVYGARIE